MAIAADFLKAASFGLQPTSFLAGKVSDSLRAQSTQSDSDIATRMLGSEGRYATSGFDAIQQSSSPFTVSSRTLGYNQKDAVANLTSGMFSSLLSTAPEKFKFDEKFMDELRRRATYDDNDLIADYLGGYDPEQMGELLSQLEADFGKSGASGLYTYMALNNQLPSLSFYKPQGGTSGLTGTKGTGLRGLQTGFSDRLIALIGEVNRRGLKVNIGEGWRSFATQKALKVKKPTLAATAGKSNHGWGLAADLVYGNAKARQLMHDLAPKYGLRFPMSYEPWHIEPAVIKGLAKNGRVYSASSYDIYDAYAAYKKAQR